MPTFTVNVGDKEVKMPRLDIERVVKLEGREEYQNNVVDIEEQSLVSDPFLKSTAKEQGEIEGNHFVSKTSASFLNDSCSKQIVSV